MLRGFTIHSVLESKLRESLSGRSWAAPCDELIFASSSPPAGMWDQSFLRSHVPGISGSRTDWNHSPTLSSGIPVKQRREGQGREGSQEFWRSSYVPGTGCFHSSNRYLMLSVGQALCQGVPKVVRTSESSGDLLEVPKPRPRGRNTLGRQHMGIF